VKPDRLEIGIQQTSHHSTQGEHAMPNATDRYPIAESARKYLPEHREAAAVRRTGEFRVPRRGEWFISGAIPEAYYTASNIYISPYHIARLVNADGTDVQTPENTVAHVLQEGFTAPPDSGLDLTFSVTMTLFYGLSLDAGERLAGDKLAVALLENAIDCLDNTLELHNDVPEAVRGMLTELKLEMATPTGAGKT
jgi:hypothetical protein